MAITAEQRNDVITLLVGMFDAAPSAELLTGFVTDIEGGKTTAELAEDLAATVEFNSLYPVWLTNDEFATNFVNNLLGDNVSADTLQEGIDFVTASLTNGASRGEAVNTAVAALSAVSTDDATWGQAAQQLANKAQVATYFATTQDITGASFAELRAITANVTADSVSVSNQMMLIDANLDSDMQRLTVDQDWLVGSAGNDAFTAWIFDNQNTAQSGDYINGGEGRDTLFAEVGNSQDFAISLKTDSVEVANFRVQATATDSSDNDVDTVDTATQIDAQDMNGTVEFWSTDSRDDLAIEDVRNNSHETTLGWRQADAGDVDYHVFFDSQHITAPDGTTSGSQLFLEILDLEAAAATGDSLTNNPYIGVQISVGGVEYTIVGDNPITSGYPELVDALNGALTAQGLTEITASLGDEFRKFNADDGVQYAGTQIVLTNTGSDQLEGIGWIAEGTLPKDTNIHTAINDAAPSTTSNLTQVDVVWDHVGRGSKSGDFLAGNMSTGGLSGSQGIQQFNIEVQRDSWVDNVASTNNTLEVVNLENGAGFDGSVRIDDLNDVRVVDASSMSGDVTLDVDLSDDTIAKYLDLQDDQANAASDNVTFAYTLGNGNDSLDLTVSQEVAAHEDFELEVETGSGDDAVTMQFANYGGTLNNNWLADQQDLRNAVIATGSGDDTVTTTGAGNVTVNAGAGNDTVYTNNDGNVFEAFVAEQQTITFPDASGQALGNSDLDNLTPITVTLADGSTGTVTPLEAATGAAIAAAMAGQINGSVAGLAGGVVAVANGDTITLTYSEAYMLANSPDGTGDIAEAVVTADVNTDVGLTVVDDFVAGVSNLDVPALAEVSVVTFAVGGAVAAGETVIFDGTTVTLVDTDSSGAITLDELTEQVAGATYTNYSVTDYDFNTGAVVFTANAVAAGADTVVGDFTGTAITGNASVGGVVTAQAGQVAVTNAEVAEVQTLAFTAADETGTFTLNFDVDISGGTTETAVSVAVDDNDSAFEVAAKALAAINAVDGLTAVAGVTDDVVNVTFDNAADGLVDAAATTATDGALQSDVAAATETVEGALAADGSAATWVVNADNTQVNDLDGSGVSASGLLYGATVEVTFSGATVDGSSGVTSGAAVADSNGFESSVTLSTSNYLANEATINQALKEAINDDVVLSKVLTADDNADHSLTITSAIDGRFNEADLDVTLTAATFTDLSASEQAALKNALADLNNDSDAVYTDAEMQAALDAAVAAFAPAANMGTDVAGDLMSGTASATDSDNIVDLGAGDDVVVLGTDATSTDTLLFTGTSIGNNAVFNFDANGGADADTLDFTAYLTGESSVSGSAASTVAVANSVAVVSATGNTLVGADEIVIINDFAGTATETWAGMSAADLLAAIEGESNGTDDYANIEDDTLEVAELADLVGSTQNNIVMVENDNNDGEYKVFHVESTVGTTDEFESATLLGTIDFGDTITAAVDIA